MNLGYAEIPRGRGARGAVNVDTRNSHSRARETGPIRHLRVTDPDRDRVSAAGSHLCAAVACALRPAVLLLVPDALGTDRCLPAVDLLRHHYARGSPSSCRSARRFDQRSAGAVRQDGGGEMNGAIVESAVAAAPAAHPVNGVA